MLTRLAGRSLISWFAFFAAGLLVLLGDSRGMSFAAETGELAIDGFQSNGVGSSGRARGFRFRTDAPLRVLGLAVADVVHDGITLDSDATGVDVSLWDDAGHQLALAKVAGGTAAELRGDFRIVDLASPVLLEPGAYYRVAADMADIFEFYDGNHFSKATVTSTNFISMVQQADTAGTIGNGRALFPSFLGDIGVADLGANLVVEVVPEPSTLVLLAASGATVLLSRRLWIVRRR
jgi:hypothetical protein